MVKWTTMYINDLPNSAFVIIEPDYIQKKTSNKQARHLPIRNEVGDIDLPHLQNALARVNQLKPVTNSITREELISRAQRRLNSLSKRYLKE